MKDSSFLQPKLLLSKKIALVLFGLFIFFMFLEAGLRLGGAVLSARQEHRNLLSIKQKGTYRILCLGESTTAGEYPQFLEEILNQSNVGVSFSVIDKGVTGTNTSAILFKLESYLNKYHPDMIVTMMGINDQGERLPYETPVVSKAIFSIQSFKTYKLARLLWLHILAKTQEVFYKPYKTNRNFGKSQAYFPEAEFKRDHAEFISAEASLKKNIELNPKNDNLYVDLGVFYRYQQKYALAEDLLNQAIKLNPRNDNAYVRLGEFYRDQGKTSQAEAAWKKAIELNPENLEAYSNLGWSYRDQEGNIFQAEAAWKKAIERNSVGSDWVCADLGWLYRDQGKTSQAEAAWKKAIELNPENDGVYVALSMLYEEIGKSDLAKEYAKKVDRSRLEDYSSVTVSNYRKLKEILDKGKIRLVCAQYPMRKVESLRKIFDEEDIIFVDNEAIFQKAVKEFGLRAVFRDMFGDNFGHCTKKGNQILAQNIANTILKEVFGKNRL